MASLATKQSNISFQDYIELSAVVFHWGDSYDAKDWGRLSTIIAPTLKIDYRLVMDERWYWPTMSAKSFIEMVSSPGFLGDPCIKTQHLLGATWWERLSDTEVIGHHQLRAAHLRFTAPDLQRVSRRGHGHATNEHYYTKVDGVWKFAGLRPTVRWNEYDFDKIFKGLDFPEEKKSAENSWRS